MIPLNADLKDLHIEVKENDNFPNLQCLNYSMIDSPRHNDIVNQCRGHIIDKTTNEFVCRPFDRFYNLGEVELPQDLDWKVCKVVDKIDGSLIKMWHYENTNEWHIGTRASFDGTNSIKDGITFKQLFIKALNRIGYRDIQDFAQRNGFNKHFTYIFELTSPYNQVVIDYGIEPQLWLLGVRNKHLGEYFTQAELDIQAVKMKVNRPKTYQFTTLNECREAAKNLPFSEEGYIVYDSQDKPILKIKSPQYVEVHLLCKGGNVTEKDLIRFVWRFEEAEFKAYNLNNYDIDKYVEIRDNLIKEIYATVEELKPLKADRKAVALSIKNKDYNSLIFDLLYKESSLEAALDRLSDDKRINLILNRIATIPQ